jgi:hypothetical protein
MFFFFRDFLFAKSGLSLFSSPVFRLCRCCLCLFFPSLASSPIYVLNMDPQLVCNEISGAGFESLIHDYEQVAEGELCRIGALKSTFPAVVQSELPETGGRGAEGRDGLLGQTERRSPRVSPVPAR